MLNLDSGPGWDPMARRTAWLPLPSPRSPSPEQLPTTHGPEAVWEQASWNCPGPGARPRLRAAPPLVLGQRFGLPGTQGPCCSERIQFWPYPGGGLGLLGKLARPTDRRRGAGQGFQLGMPSKWPPTPVGAILRAPVRAAVVSLNPRPRWAEGRPGIKLRPELSSPSR